MKNKAAQQLGSIKTEKKAISSRLNGKASVQPHVIKVRHFLTTYPYPLKNNEWIVKFNLGIKTKTGREATYNPDFYCPTTGYYVEVVTSEPNKSEQGWKWEKILQDGQKLKIYWWEGKEITEDYKAKV